MKRQFVFAALVIWAAVFNCGNSIAQEGLMAGNVLGIHVLEYELAPGVTEADVITFLKGRYLAAYEQHPEMKTLFLRGDRGDNKGRIAYAFIFNSVDIRDKYYNADGSETELTRAQNEKMKPVQDEWNRHVTNWSTKYTDWVVIKSPFTSQGIPVAGNILGIHTELYVPEPGVTEEEYLDFWINKFIPENEKIFPDIKLIGLRGIRGDNEGCISHLLFFESNEVRARYWGNDGPTDLGKDAMGKIIPMIRQSEKMASTSTTITDWLIEKE
jgi:hypothetical protein